MFCTQCGVQLQETDKYCSQCAAPTPVARAEQAQHAFHNPPRPLRRSMNDKKLGGVCSGIAEFANVDVVLVRVLAVAGTLVSCGAGLLAYIAAWMIVPLDHGPQYQAAAQRTA